MKIDASVGRAPKTADVRKTCRTLKLTAQDDDEAKQLAQLYVALTSRKSWAVTIDPKEK